jgi:hypothetical protein
MRRLALIAFASALGGALLAAGGCTTSRADGSGRIETTAEAKRDSLEGVVSAPLRDVNLLRTKIPPVLLDAIADPYQRPSIPAHDPPAKTCRILEALVKPLDAALGPDLDAPDREEGGLTRRGRDAAMGAMATAASSVIPFRSWVRKLTGAERHDALVQDAISAGAVRRAYLKGLGEANGCEPPATPSHARAGTPPPSQEIRPLYPLR